MDEILVFFHGVLRFYNTFSELPAQVWDQVNYVDTIDWSRISSYSHLSAMVDLEKPRNTMFIAWD